MEEKDFKDCKVYEPYERRGAAGSGGHIMLEIFGTICRFEGCNDSEILQDKIRVLYFLELALKDNLKKVCIEHEDLTEDNVMNGITVFIGICNIYNIQRRLLEFYCSHNTQEHSNKLEQYVYPSASFINLCKEEFKLTDDDMNKYNNRTIFNEEKNIYDK